MGKPPRIGAQRRLPNPGPDPIPASAWSQVLAPLGALIALWAPAAHAQQSASFKPERFDEDWPQGAPFKHLPLAPGIDVSFGGDARWRGSALDAPHLGLYGEPADAWLLQRFLLHADLRVRDDARVFVELGAHDGIGRDSPSSTDDDRIDLQQAFLDLRHDWGEARVTARIGRQELALGPRFVTTRDSSNVRQRHDMARVIVAVGENQVDAFWGHPTAVKDGAFDDGPDMRQTFYGLRARRNLAGGLAEAYAYELDRDAVTLAGRTARDRRLSVGAHLAGRDGDFDYDVEAVVQTGRFGDQDILATGLIADAGRRFAAAPFQPRIGARITYGGGDADPGDGRQTTFAPAFSTGSWFGQNGLASFSNTVEVAALANLTLTERVSSNLKLAGVWRADPHDFLYTGSSELTGTAGGRAFTGVGPSVSLTWKPSPRASLTTYASYLAAGHTLGAAGAHDVAYALASLSLRF